MLQNAYFLAKIGADTAENEQHFVRRRAAPRAGPRGAPGREPRPPRRARGGERGARARALPELLHGERG